MTDAHGLALFGAPDRFHLAFEGRQAVFVEMDREAFHRSIFLDGRISTARPGALKADWERLYAGEAAKFNRAAEVSYIFHVAHCGSTLLARALDRKDRALVYREPMALRQLGVARAASYGGACPDTLSRQLRFSAHLLARRYEPGGPAIVKANVPVNLVAADLVAMSPRPRAVFLYLALEDYLLAILRTPNHRKWAASVVGEIAPAIRAIGVQAERLNAVEAGACLWLVLMTIYARILAREPHTASLDGEALFDAPRETLAAAFAYFGMEVPAAEVEAIAGGDLFSHSAKRPDLAFDNAARKARRDAVRAEMAEELQAARRWLAAQPLAAQLPARLPQPLYGAAPALLG